MKTGFQGPGVPQTACGQEEVSEEPFRVREPMLSFRKCSARERYHVAELRWRGFLLGKSEWGNGGGKR